MSTSNFTRRGVLKTGAIAGAGLATPTFSQQALRLRSQMIQQAQA
jgi:hypothetical protein